MRKVTPFITALIILASLLSTHCSEDDVDPDVGILYPDSGFYGKNILNTADSIYPYDAGPWYGDGSYNSMKAILPSPNSSLTVEITGTRVMVYQNHTWLIDEDFFDEGNTTTVYRAEGSITADLKIFLFDAGEASIKLFENDSEVPTRIKHIKKGN